MSTVFFRALVIALLLAVTLTPLLGMGETAFEFCEETQYESPECADLKRLKESRGEELSQVLSIVQYFVTFAFAFMCSLLTGLWFHLRPASQKT